MPASTAWTLGLLAVLVVAALVPGIDWGMVALAVAGFVAGRYVRGRTRGC